MSEILANTGEVASLGVARAKLASVIEIYAPMTGRAAVLESWGYALIEFEAAIREDERAKLGNDVATAQAAAIDATATAHADRVRTEAAAAVVAAGPVDMSPPPPPAISTDGEGTDANGSPVPPTAPPAPPFATAAPVAPAEAPTGRRSRK